MSEEKIYLQDSSLFPVKVTSIRVEIDGTTFPTAQVSSVRTAMHVPWIEESKPLIHAELMKTLQQRDLMSNDSAISAVKFSVWLEKTHSRKPSSIKSPGEFRELFAKFLSDDARQALPAFARPLGGIVAAIGIPLGMLMSAGQRKGSDAANMGFMVMLIGGAGLATVFASFRKIPVEFKPDWKLMIGAAGGEKDGLVSSNFELLTKIKDAIVQALLERDGK